MEMPFPQLNKEAVKKYIEQNYRMLSVDNPIYDLAMKIPYMPIHIEMKRDAFEEGQIDVILLGYPEVVTYTPKGLNSF